MTYEGPFQLKLLNDSMISLYIIVPFSGLCCSPCLADLGPGTVAWMCLPTTKHTMVLSHHPDPSVIPIAATAAVRDCNRAGH